jgi:hypothetical protein
VLLQYADDTVFFIKDDISSAQNLKFYSVLLNRCRDLKLIITKVSYIVLERLSTRRISIA